MSPVEASHTHTNFSSEPETISLLSLENTTALIGLRTPMVTNGLSPSDALVNHGILGKCLLRLDTAPNPGTMLQG